MRSSPHASFRKGLFSTIFFLGAGHASAQLTLQDALDSPALAWSAGGPAPWLAVPRADAHAGSSVAELRLPNTPDEPPYGPWLGCTRTWLETTATGPGVFSIWMRHNNNPYIAIKVSLDGIVRESLHLYGYEPDVTWSPWHRISLPLGPGTHPIRIDHTFYCDENQGTMMVVNPTIQLDHASVTPALDDDFLTALEIPTGSPDWLAGGDGTHAIIQTEAHDGIDAIKFTPTASDFVIYDLSPPWIEKTLQGPITVSWWSRILGNQPEAVPDGPWTRNHRFIPAGAETVRWSSQTPMLLDEISMSSAPEIPLPEALDADGRLFQQNGTAWKGVRSPAAPDGIDAAWCRPLTAGVEALETTVQGPASLTFSYQTVNTGLQFHIDGQEVSLPPSPISWLLPAGIHTLRWTALKSYYADPNGLAYLDNVQIQPLTVLPLAEALDDPALTWTTGPNPWTGFATLFAPDGQDAAAAPLLLAGESAWVQTTANGPGRLTFRWTSTGAPPFAAAPLTAKLTVDGRFDFPLAHNMSAPLVEVGPGTHVFRWQVNGTATLSSAMLDQVSWTGLPEGAPMLQGLDGMAGPCFLSNAGLASTSAPAESHDGVDAVKLSPSVVGFIPDQNLSIAIEGPGTFSYWTKSSTSATLDLDQLAANSAGLKTVWNNNIRFIPPGPRILTFNTTRDQSAPSVPPTVLLDEMTLVPLATLTLPNALNLPGPWTTDPDFPWTGLPASPDFTSPAAHAPAATVENPSWLETTLEGPAVVSFSVRGSSLTWTVGQAIPVQNPNGAGAPAPAAAYIPPGRNTIRWTSAGAVASLGNVRLHPMPGTVSIRPVGDFLEINVPRPDGIPDANIKIQVQDSGNFWYLDSNAAIQSSDAANVIFRLPKPMVPSRIYRVVFSPP
ncbi:MAG: N-acetylmuramoyl-L-alanine amidase, family 2 domain protein [Verrucomicrobiales bacterium]|nr:N-acetylmuramoyl-L-alanine amidase, family 2 domain protein [Verrucomicrobiales bacterium]